MLLSLLVKVKRYQQVSHKEVEPSGVSYITDGSVTWRATLKSSMIISEKVKHIFSTFALQASHLVPKANLVYKTSFNTARATS